MNPKIMESPYQVDFRRNSNLFFRIGIAYL